MWDRISTDMRRAVIAAMQSGAAAGLAWWLAQTVLSSPKPLYAPVAAVVVIGAGYERRAERVTAMLGGMALAVAISEIGTRLLGSGAIQIAMLTALSIVVARRFLSDLQAVTYAAVNAALLVAIGGDGWIPDRLLEGVVGAASAYALVYLIFPPRPGSYIRSGVTAQASVAADNLRGVATALRTDDIPKAQETERRTDRVDRRGSELADTFDFSHQVTTFSPWRRRERQKTVELRARARALQVVFRDATALARVAGWQLRSGHGPHPRLADALDRLATAVETAGTAIDADPTDDCWYRMRETLHGATTTIDDASADSASRATASGVVSLAESLGEWIDGILAEAPDMTPAGRT